jgi:hypothetical protein
MNEKSCAYGIDVLRTVELLFKSVDENININDKVQKTVVDKCITVSWFKGQS